MKKLLTLCFIVENNKILLAMKKRGFGAGKWNGYGGKLEGGESIYDAACREVNEEIGINPLELHQQGIITFIEAGEPDLEVHIFKITNYKGEPVESEEMKPEWFEVDKIPYDIMWVDDKYWLPLMLENKLFMGEFVFENEKIIDYKLDEVKSLDFVNR